MPISSSKVKDEGHWMLKTLSKWCIFCVSVYEQVQTHLSQAA